jgi:PAS domain S-box-containing protein
MRERLQAEKALRESEAKFRHIFDNAPVMMFSTDEQGIILDVSNTWCNVTGYTREETVGRPLNFIMTTESAAEVSSLFNPRLKNICSISDMAFQIIPKSGQLLDVLVNCVTSADPAGKRVGLFVVRDITWLKTAEVVANILIVDDDKMMCNMLARMFDRGGHSVDYAYTIKDVHSCPCRYRAASDSP